MKQIYCKRHITLFFSISVLLIISFISIYCALAPHTNEKDSANISIPNSEWDGNSGTIHSNIPYGDKPNLFFDLYLPAGLDKNEPQGLILFIHGGGWIHGTRTEMDTACKTYANAGYITATIEYSLMSEDHPEINFFSMLDEIEDGISEIRKTTDSFGYTVNKIALAGHSAGAHLALLYAYSRIDTSPLPIAFVFDQSGPADFHIGSWDVDINTLAKWISKMSGRKVTIDMLKTGQAEEIIASISPPSLVTKNTPPTIVVHGTKDDTVTIINSEILTDALDRNEVTHTYIEFPNSVHSLRDDPDCSLKAYRTVLSYANTYLKSQ